MRIFVTGASGWIGSAVVPELLTAGHEVVGLARLAVEAAPAGSVLHAVADEGVPLREVAGAMGRHLGVPTKSVSPQEAPGHFGFLAHFAALDSPVTATATRELLGWEPTGPSLLDDLEADHYYRQA